MRNPRPGEANLGALAGSVVGAIGGLFAIGIAPAIINRNAALLFETPMLAMFSFFVGGGLGWLLGGQIGPRLGETFQRQKAEVTGGVVGGLLPVIAIALWSWYMVARH